MSVKTRVVAMTHDITVVAWRKIKLNLARLMHEPRRALQEELAAFDVKPPWDESPDWSRGDD